MKKLIIYFLLLLSFPLSINAQVDVYQDGVLLGGGATLKDAFDYINAGGAQGVIVLQITDNTTEPATCVLNASGSSGGLCSYTSVTIYPIFTGLTIRDDGTWDGPLIVLDGADNVTIDGRLNATGSAVDLSIKNSSISNTSGTSTISFINDATNNTIKYLNIKGSSTATQGGILFFSTTTGTTGNDGNIIDNNNITNSVNANRPVNAIYSLGTISKENSGNTISNNNIYDILNIGLTSNGIFLDSFNSAWTISGNSFYETTSFIPAASVDYNLVQINNTGINYSITGTYFGGQAASCGGSAWTKTNAFDNVFYAINLNAGAGTASSIQNNTIQNFAWSNSGAASWTGINIAGGDVNIGTVNGNTIGATTGTGSITITGGATNTNVYGINISGGGTVDCQNNNVGSIISANGAANATNFYGINKTAVAGTTTISSNIIGSTSTVNSINASSASSGNTQSIYGISNSGTGNVEIRDNIIANLTNSTTNLAGSISGIYFNGSTAVNAVMENFIYSLTTANASNTASVYGIRINNGAASYYNNIISLGGNTQTTIYGIYETGTSGNNNNIYFNSVYIGGSPTAGSNKSYALYSAVTTNTRNFRNNIFYNARSNSGASGTHYAMYIVSAGGTLTCDYNDYYTPGSGGILGFYGGDKTALPVVTGQDLHSFAINPLFFNAGGSSASDYLGSETSLIGITGTSITTDYNGAPRSLPALGALEFGPCTNPTSGGSIAGGQNNCSAFDPVPFTSTLPASGHIGTILEYKWQQSIISGSTGFLDISSTNSTTYDPGLTTQTTWYKRLARVSCTGVWTGAAESNVLAIVVNTPPVANAISGGSAVCMGNSISLTSNATGTPTLTYTWNSSNTGVATISNAGVLTTVSGGSTNITYTVTDGNSPTCQTTSAIHVVNVNALPVANLITGANAVCMGGSLSLTPNATGTVPLTYTWFSENESIETVSNTGIVTPVSPGVTNIRYTVTDGSSTACQAISGAYAVTINALPVAEAITGLNDVCVGGSLLLTSHASGTQTLLYNWNSSNTGVATVSSTGVVTPVSAGSTNITYTVTDGSTTACQATSAIHTVNVHLPVAGAITGGNAVCMGSTLALTSHATGTPTLTYIWNSSNVGVATISNSGVVTPVSAGSTNITYTVTDGSSTSCQATSAINVVTVNDLPVAGAITGGNAVCMGSSLSLSSHATGTPTLTYIWTSSNTGVATVNNSGVVTSVSAGSTNITYTVTDGSPSSCQATSAINTVTVNALPIAGAITGGNAVLLGSTLSLSSPATGTGTLSYVWNSSNTGVATVSNSGVVTPVSAGSTNITYTVTDGSPTACQATSAILAVNVSFVVAGNITGENAVCMGSTLSLTSNASGTPTLTYTWTSSNTGVATVSNTGLITPVSAGSTNITYTVTEGSPSAFQATSAILVLTVNALPAINLVAGGTGTICSGTGTNITVDLSQTGTNYQLRNASGNINVGVPVAGTGGTISLPTGNLTSNTTFNILATNALTNCSAVLTETEIVSVDALPAGGTITGGSGPITYGSSTGTFTLSGQSGTIVNWQNMVGTGSWIDISNTTTNYSETPSSAGTWQYRAQVINGFCPAVFSIPVSISVLPKLLTITADNQTKSYGTSFTFLGTEFTVTGLINSDALTNVSLSSTGAAATANVPGSPYSIIPATAIGTGLSNYTITYTNGSLSVTKPILTVMADNKSRAYLIQNPVLTYTVAGYVNSESVSVLDVLPSVQTTALQSSNAGSYPITISGGSDNNYTYLYVPGTLSITKIPQTITFTGFPDKLLAEDSYTLTATSTSGLTVLFESLNTELATISGNNLTGVAKGNVSIRAYNTGDQNYNAAEVLATVKIYSTHKEIMHLFTPNNDGINDQWELPDLPTWGKCDVRVFNRWGKLVFADANYNNLWDGTSNGSPLPEGPYYFIIKTENAGVVKGTVNIVR